MHWSKAEFPRALSSLDRPFQRKVLRHPPQAEPKDVELPSIVPSDRGLSKKRGCAEGPCVKTMLSGDEVRARSQCQSWPHHRHWRASGDMTILEHSEHRLTNTSSAWSRRIRSRTRSRKTSMPSANIGATSGSSMCPHRSRSHRAIVGLADSAFDVPIKAL